MSLKSWLRRKLKGEKPKQPYVAANEYTVVTAVYNTAQYLDDFFESLYKQTISKDKIRVIAVDDGSTDDSAAVIARWQERWPGAITYLLQENAGQAAARNTGLDHVKTEWVTFIDSDDFVSEKYFEGVDRSIKKHPTSQFLFCNILFYRENRPEDERVSNTHGLAYRFKKGTRFFSVNDENHPFQMSAASSFMRMSIINELGLRFDTRIKPNYEDGHLIALYMLGLEDGEIGLLKGPKYYYRKRDDKSSTIDKSWSHPGRFSIVPEYGYLDVLKRAKAQLGHVPIWLQSEMIYELSWSVKRFENHPERSQGLANMGLLDTYRELMGKVFSYVELDTLYACRSTWLNYDRKYLTASFFKNEPVAPYAYMYLTELDLPKKQLLIRSVLLDVEVLLDGVPVQPVEEKLVSYNLLGETWGIKKLMCIPYESEDQDISFRSKYCDNIMLSVWTKAFKQGCTVGDAIARFTKDWDEYPQKGDLWIVMDRDMQADDNAEHFYRWLMQNHPEQESMFVLRKTSRDWARLEAEGFNLIDFGSPEHEEALKRCSSIISSHADAYVHSYYQDNFHRSKHYVFLQHGITTHNISSWLNRKFMAMVVTATPAEQQSIIEQESPYIILPSRVKLTGFPRHDALIRKAAEGERNEILVMPTWRKYLAGEVTRELGNERLLNPEFETSDFRNSWQAFLNSPRLKELAEKTECKVVFFPHANLVPYVEAGYFEIPEWVQVAKNDGESSIQDHFARAAVCITDYSSVGFEVAIAERPVVYYQFDKEEYYSQDSAWAHGYFEFERDGYGPVAYDEEAALAALEEVAANGFAVPAQYKERADRDFVCRDGKCCERVYEAIKAL